LNQKASSQEGIPLNAVTLADLQSTAARMSIPALQW
jgi:hypothetical protein